LGYFFGFQQNGYDRIHSKIFFKRDTPKTLININRNNATKTMQTQDRTYTHKKKVITLTLVYN